MMKLLSWKRNGVVASVAVATVLIWSAPSMSAGNHDGKFGSQQLDAAAVETAQPQAAATPTAPPVPQIDGHGTITAPNGGRDAEFIIMDVENEQVTPQYLEGIFAYLDKRSHVSLTTGKIETVTINGNQGAFSGTARIGGPRNKQIVNFTVTVTVNTGTTPDTFSLVLSNGYSASGNVKSGSITIQTLDPD